VGRRGGNLKPGANLCSEGYLDAFWNYSVWLVSHAFRRTCAAMPGYIIAPKVAAMVQHDQVAVPHICPDHRDEYVWHAQYRSQKDNGRLASTVRVDHVFTAPLPEGRRLPRRGCIY
jgi:ABC-type Co2+ transport system permease subunit